MVLVVVVFATVNTLLLACDPQHVDFCLLNVALAGSSALVLCGVNFCLFRGQRPRREAVSMLFYLFLVLLYGLAAGLFAR